MKRDPASPVITRVHITSRDPRIIDPSSVFNPGGVFLGGQILLLLRVQNRGRQTFLLKASSKDGTDFDISDRPVVFSGLQRFPYQIYHIYDPRIVHLGGRFLVTAAMDTPQGCRVGIFESEDLQNLEYLGMMRDEPQRNGVLFPQLFEGYYLMLSRPNEHTGPDGVESGTRIVCYSSPDLVSWKEMGEVMQGRAYYWDELIGSGPPPIRTPLGWLHLYHGVATHFGGGGIYQAGVSLLDIDEPWKLIARGPYNVLEPREGYETCGQVPNVVFPTAAFAMAEDGIAGEYTPIFIYYGAADSCIGLAKSTLKDLLSHSGIQQGDW